MLVNDDVDVVHVGPVVLVARITVRVDVVDGTVDVTETLSVVAAVEVVVARGVELVTVTGVADVVTALVDEE